MRVEAPLIVGGGPAGAVAALRLAQAGHRATLLERTRETGDALCGGFLSWRTLASLREVGIDGIGGHSVRRLRLFAGNRTAERALPAPAIGVSRRRLDTLLLDAAARAGAAIERDVHVRGWANGALQADGSELRPDTLFLATGKHELRGLARPRAAAGDDPAIGLRVRLAPSPTLTRLVGDAIELHLFDAGYAGLVLQEDGSANLCMAVRKSRLECAGGVDALLGELARLPHLDARLACGHGPADAVAHVPYGWRARGTAPGVFRLGDQAGVIPSLAGEGMGIAIASAIRAADAWVAGGGGASVGYQRRLARSLARPIEIAGWIAALGTRPATAPWLVAAARAPGAADLAARVTRIGRD